MNAAYLPVIPEPQQVARHDGQPLTVSALSRQRAVLSIPREDDRLNAAAERIFGDVDASPQGEPGAYGLVSGTRQWDWDALERIAGKPDGYVLRIAEDGVEAYAETPEGLFYGLMTLEQCRRLAADGQLAAEAGAIPPMTIADWADVAVRSDYLDLRVIYPVFENILAYVAEMASYKVNTLVVEYEDKLPFRRLAALRHPVHAWTEEQHRLFLEAARRHFVQIIPKQQSFGHLEYVLRHPDYIRLRETPDSVGEICPHRPGAYEIVAALLEEVAAAHPDSRYLHMGCDEVWSLGACEACRQSGLTRERSFIRFVNRLAAKVCELGKTPLIWHDMLAHASPEEIAELDRRVVVVVWIYGGHRMRRDARELIRKFRGAGLAVWGASAVRCWDDSGDQNYPLIRQRLDNVRDWTELAGEERLPAIVNTNWAVPFALGSPYGLFETSRYPVAYAADIQWNRKAERADFLQRFLLVHHRLDPSRVSAEELGDYRAEDYYALLPELLPAVRRNRLTAEWLAAIDAFETYAKRRFPLHTFLYRADWSRGSEETMTSLGQKYRTNYGELAKSRASMRAIAGKLLHPEMADMYVESRYYLLDLYEEKWRRLEQAYREEDEADA
ncbi:family 20 glycosylhydrolase [Paenibacillaceae bacterium WGS1546]|uniref:family 20 glycosylhydrolase n=1 Tax=Cohnella sp. WGS1546 TaxID=3366810 RepID=UPI00372D70DB